MSRYPADSYLGSIVAATGCPDEAAPEVEDLMRVESPTLDHLRPEPFDDLARRAWRAYQRGLRWMDADPSDLRDPGTRPRKGG